MLFRSDGCHSTEVNMKAKEQETSVFPKIGASTTLALDAELGQLHGMGPNALGELKQALGLAQIMAPWQYWVFNTISFRNQEGVKRSNCRQPAIDCAGLIAPAYLKFYEFVHIPLVRSLRASHSYPMDELLNLGLHHATSNHYEWREF